MTRKRHNTIYRFIPLTLFLILFLMGIALNEPQRVMEQGWTLCLSCIGIG